jgi:hypothetical protein
MNKMMFAHHCKKRVLETKPEAISVHRKGCYIRLEKPSWKNLWRPETTSTWAEYTDAWIQAAYWLGLLTEEEQVLLIIRDNVGELPTYDLDYQEGLYV